MTEQLTPARAEQAIQFYLHQLGELTGEYAAASDAKATTEADFKIAWARSRVKYRDQAATNGWKSTDAVTDDHATLQTEDELRARLLASAREESVKLAARSCQSKLDGARSLAAAIRNALA